MRQHQGIDMALMHLGTARGLRDEWLFQRKPGSPGAICTILLRASGEAPSPHKLGQRGEQSPCPAPAWRHTKGGISKGAQLKGRKITHKYQKEIRTDFKKESNSKNRSNRGGKVQNTGWQSTYQCDVLNVLLFLFLRQNLLGMLQENLICLG